MSALLRRLLAPALVLALATAGAARADPLRPPADARAEARIGALFTEARGALGGGDGAAVLPLLSRASLARLEAIRAAARNGAAANLTSFGPAEKVAVLSLRRFLTPAQLRTMRTPELANHALAEHWLGPSAIDQASLGPLAIEGDRASAPLLVKGKPGLVRAAFLRESGQWKIDLIPTVTVADDLLRLFAGIAGQSEDVYAAKLAGRMRRPPADAR